MDFINDFDAESIFNLIKSRYKAETGMTIQIGSEEFAISSLVAYIFGVMINRFNEQAKQRYLSTATGEYLDALAETFAVERPKPTHATCTMTLTVNGSVTLTRDFTVAYNGIKFHPIEAGTHSSGHPEPWDVPFIGSDSNPDVSKENNIDSGTVFTIMTPHTGIIMAVSANVTSGASDLYPMTDEGDDAFRAYIKEMRAAKSVAGPAAAYETLARACDSRILDVYCKRYNDSGFIPGEASLYILVSDADYTDHWSEIQAKIRLATNADSVRPVCDIETITRATYTSITINVYVRVSAQYGASWRNKVEHDIDTYTAQINTKLGGIFSISELSRLCRTPDANGTCVELIQCVTPSQSLIQPAKWEANNYTIQVTSYEII